MSVRIDLLGLLLIVVKPDVALRWLTEQSVKPNQDGRIAATRLDATTDCTGKNPMRLVLSNATAALSAV